MNKVAAFALRRKNSILSMSEKMFCPPQPLRFWITPACAGKRGRKEVAPMSNRDHPRVCGEKRSVKALLSAVMESPPHVRGKAGHPVTRRAYRGITPAYAGKRGSGSPPRSCRRDHPRVCGKSGCSSSSSGVPWDHPRVCGEKYPVFPGLLLHLGSPPRVRGKGRCQLKSAQSDRITPAYAGKSHA